MRYLILIAIILSLASCKSLRTGNVGFANNTATKNDPAIERVVTTTESEQILQPRYDTDTPVNSLFIIVGCVVLFTGGLALLYKRRSTTL